MKKEGTKQQAAEQQATEQQAQPSMKRFVASCIRERLTIVTAALHHASSDPADVEAIHDLRVATRRLVQCLRSFKQFLDKPRAKRIRRQLSELRRQCGAARDLDITMELLDTASESSRLSRAEAEEAIRSLAVRRRDAEQKVAKVLARWQRKSIGKKWAKRLAVSRGKGPWKHNQTPAANARRVLPGLAATFFDDGARATMPQATEEQMHRFRIDAKHLRYTLELFAEVAETTVPPLLAELKKLQTSLGEINDCVSARALIAEHPASPEQIEAAIEHLAEERKTQFRKLWNRNFGEAAAERWQQDLSSIGRPPEAPDHAPTPRSNDQSNAPDVPVPSQDTAAPKPQTSETAAKPAANRTGTTK